MGNFRQQVKYQRGQTLDLVWICVELRLCDVLTPGWLNGLRLRELVPNRQHSNIHRAQELVDYLDKLRHEEYKTTVLQPRS